MIARRRQTVYEKHFTDMHMDTEFGIELCHPKLIPEYVERFRACFLAARVRLDGPDLVSLNHPSPLIRLPDCNNLEEACTWLAHHPHPFSTSIGSIGANDRFVAVTSNHMMADGGYFSNMLEIVQDPSKIPEWKPLPESVEVTFADRIAQLDHSLRRFDGTKMTVAKSKAVLPEPCLDQYAYASSFRMPVSRLSCYSPSTQKCVRLTERMWVSMIMALCALEGTMDRLGICCPVDLRRYLKSVSMANCNTFSVIWTHANVAPSQTIADLEKALRREFDRRMERGDGFAYHDPLGKRIPHLYGSRSEVSHLARLKYRAPIKDVWAQLTSRNFRNEMVSLLAFSIVNDGIGRNEFCGRVRMPQSSFTESDAKRVTSAVEFSLRNLSDTMTIQDTFSALTSHMKHL